MEKNLRSELEEEEEENGRLRETVAAQNDTPVGEDDQTGVPVIHVSNPVAREEEQPRFQFGTVGMEKEVPSCESEAERTKPNNSEVGEDKNKSVEEGLKEPCQPFSRKNSFSIEASLRQRHTKGNGDEEKGKVEPFKNIICVLVKSNGYSTPGKGDQRQQAVRNLIRERARAFARDSKVSSGHVSYSPSNSDGFACFYHGTWLSMSEGFSREGIKPFKRNTEFSLYPAFYVTNDVAVAFEFPLYNRMARNQEDTISVYCFELELAILHGYLPSPSGKTFKVLWFPKGHDEAWQKFCHTNLYGGQLGDQHGYDIVIGSMCFPNFSNQTVIPRKTKNLLQVAFCSEEAWKWVGSSVKRLYIENRVSTV